jgi:hypothetical protein
VAEAATPDRIADIVQGVGVMNPGDRLILVAPIGTTSKDVEAITDSLNEMIGAGKYVVIVAEAVVIERGGGRG